MLLDKYPIFQQAYLVNDLEEAAIKWNKIFGAGPFVCLLYTSDAADE